MTIFKYLVDGKLYFLYKGVNGYVAIPFEHSGGTISNPDLKEFVPVKMGNGFDGFI